jgi:hypothetical protein
MLHYWAHLQHNGKWINRNNYQHPLKKCASSMDSKYDDDDDDDDVVVVVGVDEALHQASSHQRDHWEGGKRRCG